MEEKKKGGASRRVPRRDEEYQKISCGRQECGSKGRALPGLQGDRQGRQARSPQKEHRGSKEERSFAPHQKCKIDLHSGKLRHAGVFLYKDFLSSRPSSAYSFGGQAPAPIPLAELVRGQAGIMSIYCCAPTKNRTWISSFGGLCFIH